MAIPIVILAGGQGIWLDSSGKRKSKALVEIEKEPLLYWLLKGYTDSGFTQFIISAGYQFSEIKNLFSERYCGKVKNLNNETATYEVYLHGKTTTITVTDTGLETSTADRVKKVQHLLDGAPTFGLTYSDTISSLIVREVLDFHLENQRVATLIGVHAPTRFRILGLKPADSVVYGFAAKPIIQNNRINGGYYFFNYNIFSEKYLGKPSPLVLEEDTLETLALHNQIVAYPFDGDWGYLDCERDIKLLTEIVRKFTL